MISWLHRGTGGLDHVAVCQALERHLALDQLLLQDFVDRLQLEFILAGEHDLVVLLVQLNLRVRILQIVARGDFLHGLLDGIGHLRQFDFGNNVEAIVWHVL